MRSLGYPPGWLKMAEINHSNITLFVGQDQALPDAGDEDGEIADSDQKKQYDVSKLQDWPGFNVDFDTDLYRDETDKFRAQPLSKDQSREIMVKGMSAKEQKGYVRGEMQDTSTKKEVAKTDKGGANDTCMKTPVKVALKTKSVDEGTPIVQLHSPFTSLPSQDKWTTNTTDHIMFENLPDSTGKWDEMSGLIKKIRSSRKK